MNKMLPRNNKDNFLCAAVVRESKPPSAVSDAEALKEKLFLKANLLMPVLLAVWWQLNAFVVMKNANNSARCNTIIGFAHQPILSRNKNDLSQESNLLIFYAAAMLNMKNGLSGVASLITFFLFIKPSIEYSSYLATYINDTTNVHSVTVRMWYCTVLTF